jgi:hypothetical protein
MLALSAPVPAIVPWGETKTASGRHQSSVAFAVSAKPASLQRPHGFLHGRKLDPSVGPTGY